MPNPKTLDNPNDIAIREQQRQHRLAQGTVLAARAKEDAEAPPMEYSESFIFRFRKVRNGPFAGLWELAALKRDGKVEETIVDADALPNVLEAIGNIFSNRGF